MFGVAAMAVLVVAGGCDEMVTPAETAPVTATAPVPVATPAPAAAAVPGPNAETDPVKATERRVRDLVAIHAALEAYHQKNGQYPAAPDGLKSIVDRGPEWIPGLVPDFMAELPRDPLVFPNNDGPQYLYASDTEGYKLIAVSGSGGRCGPEVEKQGIKIDPARNKEVGCWGFGFWTPDYETF
jgi:hypothetical protein